MEGVSREMELYLNFFLIVYISCYKFEVNRAKGCRKWSDFYSKCVKTTPFLTAALLFNHQHTHVRELSKKETCFYSNEF